MSWIIGAMLVCAVACSVISFCLLSEWLLMRRSNRNKLGLPDTGDYCCPYADVPCLYAKGGRCTESVENPRDCDLFLLLPVLEAAEADKRFAWECQESQQNEGATYVDRMD